MSTAARPSSTRIGVLVLNTRESMGSVQHVHAIIARRLDKDQFSVLVATPPRCDEPMEWDDDPDVTVMRLPLGASLSEARDLRDKVLAVTGNLRLIPSLLRLARRMRREDIRIIHTAVTPRDALVGTLLSYLTGAALLIHWHLSLDRDFAPGTYPLVWRLAFRRASRILAVSEPSRRSLLPLGIHEEKTSVLHNGVDLDRFRPDLDGNPVRREWGISPVTALVLLPGRLRRHKGHADLLEAAALLRERGRDVTVVFVGRDDPPDAAGSSGPYRPELEGSIARLGLDGCVRFVEHRADMPAVMAAADVVAVPSYDDPLPLVVVEAMACARPVVGTSSGGIPELLTDGSTGLLVPPGAPAALADAIQRLLDDAQLRARLSVTARAEVERRFSQERMAERAGDVYRRLAAA